MTNVNKRTLIIVASITGAFLLIGAAVVTLIFILISKADVSGHVVLNEQKQVDNNTINLSLGKLKGTYDIETIQIEKPGQAQWSYELEVNEGTVNLVVEADGENIWENTTSEQDSGMIDIDVQTGQYQLKLDTKEASDIELRFKLGS